VSLPFHSALHSIHLPFALSFHWPTCFSGSISFSPLCSFSFLSRIPLVPCTLPFHPFCLQTLLPAFTLNLFLLHYSHTMQLGVSLSSPGTPLKNFSCTFLPLRVPSLPRFLPHTLSVMLSNIILLLKSPSHFLSPIPQTHPTTYLSDVCLTIGGSFVECVTQVFKSFTLSIFLPSQVH
jgi:hypothetical protein